MDGVLNSNESFHLNHVARTEAREKRNDDNPAFDAEFQWPMGHIHAPLVERLNRIVEATDCKIVVSSAWRKLCTPEELGGWLAKKGFRFADRIIDRTGQNAKDARGGEIQDWLDAHSEVTNYVILDDDWQDITGDYTTKKHPNHFVNTDFMWGLQDDDVERALKILNKPLDSN